MKQRYILYRRKNGKFYAEDTVTKKQESLKTSDKAEALTLLHSKNEAARQPALNLRIAKAYLTATDSTFATRTWQHVLDEIIRTKTGSNQDRLKSRPLESHGEVKMVQSHPQPLADRNAS